MTVTPTPAQARRRRVVQTLRVAGASAARLLTSRIRPGAAALLPVAAMAQACQDLGATYVKLGQLIGSAPGVFGAAVSDPFRQLLDTGPPVPPGAVAAVIEAELGRPLEELFATFERQPVAAASIAVVHRATLPSGEAVAVKVLRPDVAAIVDADVAVLLPLIRFFARQGVEMIAPLHAFFSGLRQQIAEELDLRNEAAAMTEFREKFAAAGLDLIVIPHVHAELSGQKVLTMEWLDGVPIDDPRATDWGFADPRTLLLQLLKAWFTTAVLDGVFHGDLHAGNLLLLRDGRLGLIDWGILGRLDPITHWLFRRMLEACLGDPTGWRDVAEGYRFAGVSMHDDFGLSERIAASMAQAQLEPILTRPIGRVDLTKLVVTSRTVAAAAQPGRDDETFLERVRRIRTARRFWRRLVDSGVRESAFDRANFMLGKQLMYVERFGRMYLPDVALVNDRRFLRKLLQTPGPPSPLSPRPAG